MTIQRIKWGTWHDVEVITPEWPGRISAGPTPDYAATRLSMRRSLNFRIPGGRMHGLLRLKVEVWPASSAVTPTAENVVVLATLRQTLRLRGIPVQYSGPDASGNQIQLAAPTLADFQTTAAWTCNAWPVSPTPDITLAGALAWTTPLTGAIVNGTCPTSWNNLLAAVSNARVVDGNLTDRVYYALLPNGIPIGGAAGCGGSGAGAGSGFNGAGADMAHEIGHVLGFNHAPCGLPVGDTPDPNYPAYEPHDTTANRRASTGEYGLDVAAGTVMSPDVAHDFMSYCWPKWVSLYSYRRLLENPRLDPQWLALPRDTLPPLDVEWPIPWPPPRPELEVDRFDPVRERILFVIGVIRDGEVEVRHVSRVSAVPVIEGRRLSNVMLQLLSASGEVLTRAGLCSVTTLACCGSSGGSDTDGESDEGLFHAIASDPGVDAVATLSIVRDGEEVWRRNAPNKPPAVSKVEAKVTGTGILEVSWHSSCGDGHDTFLRWSGDGELWNLLAAGVRDGSAEVDLTAVTVPEPYLEVLVSDGFYTVASEPIRVQLPPRPPSVAILAPATDTTYVAGQRVRLLGMAVSDRGELIADDFLTWELDGISVGVGSDLWCDVEGGEGEHRATLRVRDDSGIGETSVVFGVTATGHPYTRYGGDICSD